ncbi:MAG: hypothetical protein OXC40_01540 [Proteobacteria bacterium]|nr:hypothetical protein [Pseudomonadota bacterium]
MTKTVNIKPGFFDAMIHERTPVVVSSEEIDFSFSSYLLFYDEKLKTIGFKNTIPLDHIHQIACKKNFILSYPLVNLHGSYLQGDGVNFVLPIKKIERILSRRKHARTNTISSNTVLQFKNPYDGVTTFKKKVISVSEGGLSIETPCSSSLFHPGQQFHKSQLFVDDKMVLETSFEVIYKRKYFDLESRGKFQVGAKFLNTGSRNP